MIKKLLLTVAALMLVGFTYSQSIQRPSFLRKDSIYSTLDKNTQVFYYDKSSSSEVKPLVVELHSWSNTADSQKEILAEQAHSKNWNYILPNFRGVNNCNSFS